MKLRSIVLVCVALVALPGCWEGPTLPDDFGQCPVSDEPPPESPIDAPTYHRDVRPILEDACTGCHAEGGIGPFSLDDYESAVTFGPLMVGAIASGQMPPWPPSTCCAPLLHPRVLDEASLAVIERWLDRDAPEGDPADAPPPPDPGGLSRVDLEIMMPQPYTPSPSIGPSDDQRCFLIDWDIENETFVTGLEVVPGRRDLVHHAIVYAIPEIQVGIYRAFDNGDDGPGWSCPGGIVQSADAYIGGWVPGGAVHDYPAGLGRRVKRNSAVVLAVHYELSAGIAPDQTGIRFKFDDSVETEVEGLAVMDPAWLVGQAMKIPAGETDVVHKYAYDPATWFNFGQSIEIHNVSLHMHEYGTRASLAIFRANGDVDCLLHIDDWDFDWQGEYFLRKPVTMRYGDKIYVECHFDNGPDNQIGDDLPSDLWWGDDKEMCIGSLMISK
jgi:hypothetical protein